MKNNSTNLISRLKKGVVALTLASVLPLSFLLAQVPYYEGFDQSGPFPADNLPFGWTQGKITGTSAANTFQRQNPPNLPAAVAISAPATLTYRAWNALAGESAFACSKALDLSTRGAASTNFRFSIYRSSGWAGNLDNIQVLVNTAPTITGALLLTDTAFGLNAINRSITQAPMAPGGVTATGTMGLNTIVVNSATGIYVGYGVSGAGIGGGALVTNIVGTTLTLSVPNTANLAATPITFTVNAGWYQFGYTIPAGAPYTATNVYVIIRGNSQFGENIHMDNFSISQFPTNMTFASCAVVAQNIANIGLNSAAPASNNWIIQIRAVVNGAGTPYGLDSLNFNTNGSDFPCLDIVPSGAKLWWMGGTPTLDLTIAQQVGTGAAVCGTNYKFVPAPTFRMDNDTNYFWITYDIANSPPATTGDCVDAEFLGMDLAFGFAGNTNQTPTIATLPGCREIDLAYCIPSMYVGTSWAGYTNNDYIRHVTLAGEASYGPGIDNAYNSVGPNAGGCTGGPCPFNSHPPDYERFAPNPGYTAVMIADGATTYNLYTQVGTWYSGNTLAAWLDLNHDGDFYDVVGGMNEKLGQTPYPPGLANSTNYPLVGAYPTYGGWWAQSFTVPSAATAGTTTLRIREVWISGNTDPCATYTYGETEDYTVTIIPDCDVIPALAGWSIWLGGFSDDWNIITNWCGGVPTTTKDAIILDSTTASNVYLGGGPSPVAPTYYPVIKNGVVATTRKLRIQGTDSITINAPVPGLGSLSVYDSLSITNSTGKLKVMSSLVDTAQVSNGNLNSTNAYIFAGGFARRRTWLTYTQGELTSKGMLPGDVIDELRVHLRSRATTAGQNYNITISYFYGTAGVCFLAPAAGNPVPPITGGPASTSGYPGTTIFSGSINLSGVPAAGGEYIIPITPFTWSPPGALTNLFIEICYNNAAFYQNDPNSYTQTPGCNTFYSLNLINPGAPAGCALTPGTTGVIRLSVQTRPNITFKFHRNFGKYPINMRSTSAARPGVWNNNGIFEAGFSIVNFLGMNGPQNIDGTNPTTFHELAITNAGNVRQNTSATVDDTLWLNSGRLILNKATPTAINTLTLNLGTPAAITRTASGYLQSESTPPNYGVLNWKIGSDMNAHVVPFINTAGIYIPFTYDPTAGTSDLTIGTYATNTANLPAPTGLPGTCTINYPNYFTGLDNSANMVDRFWITNNTGTAPVADLTFTFAPAENNGAAATFFFSQRWETSICWEATAQIGQSNPNSTTNVTPGVSAFNSVWALAFNNQPLPIELVSFEAVPVGDRVKLDWVTASEINNKSFTVERTKDTRYFDFIDEVLSYGNSTSNQYYTTYDENPLNGMQYYRLKQTDKDNRFTFSNMVPVYFGKEEAASFEIVTVVNNDNNSFTVVFKYDNSNLPYAYKVMDIAGRTVVSGEGKAAKAGTNLLNINAELAGGVYTLVIQNSKATVSRKIFRQ